MSQVTFKAFLPKLIAWGGAAHSSDMDGASQGTYSWSLSVSATEPSRPVPNFIYISVALSNQTAQTYENTQPWEFPLGTKEIRYYLKANGCTYLVGGYMATVGSGQPGAIDEELFDQIIATFRLDC